MIDRCLPLLGLNKALMNEQMKAFHIQIAHRMVIAHSVLCDKDFYLKDFISFGLFAVETSILRISATT